jgi:hypothetical protein
MDDKTRKPRAAAGPTAARGGPMKSMGALMRLTRAHYCCGAKALLKDDPQHAGLFDDDRIPYNAL